MGMFHKRQATHYIGVFSGYFAVAVTHPYWGVNRDTGRLGSHKQLTVLAEDSVKSQRVHKYLKLNTFK